MSRRVAIVMFQDCQPRDAVGPFEVFAAANRALEGCARACTYEPLLVAPEISMKIAILVFEGITALDAIGPYEVLARVPDATVQFVGLHAGTVRTDDGCLGPGRRCRHRRGQAL